LRLTFASVALERFQAVIYEAGEAES